MTTKEIKLQHGGTAKILYGEVCIRARQTTFLTPSDMFAISQLIEQSTTPQPTRRPLTQSEASEFRLFKITQGEEDKIYTITGYHVNHLELQYQNWSYEGMTKRDDIELGYDAASGRTVWKKPYNNPLGGRAS